MEIISTIVPANVFLDELRVILFLGVHKFSWCWCYWWLCIWSNRLSRKWREISLFFSYSISNQAL